jgi:hypothetical protein
LHESRVAASALVAVLLSREPKAAEVGHKSIRHCWCLLVRGGVNSQSLGEVTHGNQELSVPVLAFYGDPPERCPDVILVYEAPAPGSGAPACCADVMLLAQPLNVAPQV